jgi:hypothetical protein
MGKTESAKQYAQWSLFKPFLPEPLITFTGRNAADGLYPYRPLTLTSAPLDTSMQECRTVFYTPPVSASVARIEKEVLTVFAAFSYSGRGGQPALSRQRSVSGNATLYAFH